MTKSRFVVGIDLGTTNTALAYADTQAGKDEEVPLVLLPIPQVVQPGSVEERSLLPSFLYLPGEKELPAGSLKLPWDPERKYAVGEFARQHGSQVPTRLVSSAKSWLSHSGVDRRAPILPWKAPEGAQRVSPVEASTYYLKHLCEVWNQKIAHDQPDLLLQKQDIVLTVPASFDAVARELTVEAARAAGFEHLTLLEEPQAAFYAWIDAHRETWRKKVEVGDMVLICDIGGGTTDFTLIAVTDENGQLALTRVAVGDHILLGGDNMDLALAHRASQNLTSKGIKLDPGQMLMLWHSCRSAKEQLLLDPKASSASVTVLGRGSRVIGGTIKTELTPTDIEKVLVEGFFPLCAPDAAPKQQRGTGLQELGLPYASDAGITRHLAHFLHRQAEALAAKLSTRPSKRPVSQPSAILFNGGVCKANLLRERMLAQLNTWSKEAGGPPLKVLGGSDLDIAVARGAAYYGLVRRGKGLRIRGGTARSYYIGIESALPAIPGAEPPLKALCVVPFGMEEGTAADVPGQQFGLVVGAPVEFRFLNSSVRRTDPVGTLVEEWNDEIEEMDPLATTLEPHNAEQKPGQTVPVHLHAKVTEVGTLELWCLGRDDDQKWKLEFNVRERS